uniref:Uncharacterized protein n=1 Tax=OCS116 cluster bacterium TaxID=2030921 RepID=A0A2A4Z6Z3_9PROT
MRDKPQGWWNPDKATNELLSPYYNGHHELFIMCQGCWILRPMNIEAFLKRFGDQMHFGASFVPKVFKCKKCGDHDFVFVTGEFYLGKIPRIGDDFLKNRFMPKGEPMIMKTRYGRVYDK